MINIQSLTAARQENHILLTGLNFLAGYGDIIQIIGANGSGKTSLIRTIAGLLPPYSGDILLQDGVSLINTPDQYRNQILYISHFSQIDANFSPLQNLKDLCALQGVFSLFTSGKAKETLDFFLPKELHHEPVKYLSHGQKKRAQLACRFALEKPIILLDEAFAGLDQDFMLKFADFLEKIRGKSVIFYIEHQLIPVRQSEKLRTIHVERYKA